MKNDRSMKEEKKNFLPRFPVSYILPLMSEYRDDDIEVDKINNDILAFS